jgi:glutaredoxin
MRNRGSDLMYYILTRNECDYCPIIIKLMIVAGLKTVPQIWCENEHIGGYNELREHLGLKD